MTEISLREAKARLEELVGEIEAGDQIDITRRGKGSTHLTVVDRQHIPIDPARLRSLVETMPPARQHASDLVRSMRDSDRY